jgi:hypothetical protein
VRWAALLLLLGLTSCASAGAADERAIPTTTPPTAVAGDGTVEVRLTVDRDAVVGRRLWAEWTITNVSDHPVRWQAGGATPAVTVTLGSRPGPVRGWDGAPEHLADQLSGWAPLSFTSGAGIGTTQQARTLESHMRAIAAGQILHGRVAADLRLPAGPLPDTLTARATFGGYDRDQPRALVTARTEIRVVEDPDRVDSQAALAAFARHPALADFVEATRMAHTSWHSSLTWWRGAWELWVSPEHQDGGPQTFRLRYLPASAEVVDARTIWWGQAPEDDPDATRPPGVPPDDVATG